MDLNASEEFSDFSDLDNSVSETSDHLEINSDSDTESDYDASSSSSSLLSKDKKIIWNKNPYSHSKIFPVSLSPPSGITRYSASRISDQLSAFGLVFPDSLQKIIIECTNKEGQRVLDSQWKIMDLVELDAYIGLLILAGVHKSNNENLENLWHEKKGRIIFRETMSLKRFKEIDQEC